MAFEVEDGTGVAGANAGISIAFADAYHAARGNETWAAFSEAIKQVQIVRATDYVADVFGLALAGVPSNAGQGWVFPRRGVVAGGLTLADNAVPRQVGEVIAELALIGKTTPLLVNITRGRKKVKVGPLEVEYDGTSSVQTQFTVAVLRMAPFLSGAGGAINVKLVRC